ncbi:MAG: M28 family metallopeptidase [Parvularculaceae bacterium]|nr:M28 family metallopeptidase [Parvularculaceae bacterium]
MRLWRVCVAAWSAALVLGCVTGSDRAGAPGAAGRLKADIAWLADDDRQGREAGTPGYDAAADYVEREFASAGLSPGANGGWRQTVPLISTKRDLAAASFALAGVAQTETLLHLTDYIIGRSATQAAFSAEGALVYAGYGVSAPQQGYNDYTGLDVAGKIVVAFAGAPRGFPSEVGAYYSDTETKLQIAAAKGAVGFISIQSVSAAFPWPVAVKYADSPAMAWIGPDGEAKTPASSIRATAFMSEAGAKKLFEGEAFDYFALRTAEAAAGAPKGFALEKSARIAGGAIFDKSRSDNVIGLIEGSDPALKNEIVLLTAHLDHVGIDTGGKPGDDVINNGAMDNAVGVAVLIEAANMFRRAGKAPRRSIAFAALTAEEMGLIGADYLAHYPSFGEKRIVANVNLDMPVLLYEFTDVVAFGAERSSIGPVVAEAAASMGVKLSPDPIPEEDIFTRSDHYSFVKQGVPSVFLIIGFENGGGDIFRNFLATHYHAPTDDISLPIRYDQGVRFTELNYRIARALADAEEAPRWNPGDFFGDIFGK